MYAWKVVSIMNRYLSSLYKVKTMYYFLIRVAVVRWAYHALHKFELVMQEILSFIVFCGQVHLVALTCVLTHNLSHGVSRKSSKVKTTSEFLNTLTSNMSDIKYIQLLWPQENPCRVHAMQNAFHVYTSTSLYNLLQSCFFGSEC